jgi:hypothetical protein
MNFDAKMGVRRMGGWRNKNDEMEEKHYI